MSPERLLNHFEQICEAPDAVQRLRRFILDLAVRGKLVEQDPADEPAAELAKKIDAEKARLSQEIRGPRSRYSSTQNTGDFPYEVPTSWKWCRLSELSMRIHYGYTASAKPDIKDVRLLRITDIQNNRVAWESVPGCEIADGQVDQFLLNDGDILIARTGGTIGKSFIVKDIPVKAVFASYLIRVQGSKKLFDRYVKLFLESSVYWTQLEDGSRGAGQPNVNGQTLGKMAVPLPPLSEQRRIAAKVDELMALCDKLEAAQAKRERRRDRLVAATLHGLNNGDASPAPGASPTFKESARFYLNHLPRLTTRPEHINQLRQTILNLAVRGKLVKQNPSDEPAPELLNKIEKEKGRLIKIGRARKTHPFQKTNNSESPFELPEKWQWVSLMDLGITQTGNTPSKNNPEYFGTYIPFVKPADLTGVEINYAGEGISQEGLAYARLIPKGSVLMVCIGSSIGKVNRTARDICCNQQINTITPFVSECGSFIALSLKASFFQRMILDQAGTGTLPIISKGKWEKLPVPMPPLSEQYRIVAKVDGLMALCDKLEARLTTNATARHQLLEATLQEALVS